MSQSGPKIDIEFVNEGERMVWDSDGKDLGIVDNPIKTTAKLLTYEAKSQSPKYIFVADKSTGFVFQKAVSAMGQAQKWVVAETDKTRVYETIVEVTSGGKPLAAAVVKLQSGSESRLALLSPKDAGRLSLFNLLKGPLSVQIEYKSSKGQLTSPKQTFELGPSPNQFKVKTIEVPDAIDIIVTPVAPAQVPTPKQEAPAPSNPIVSIMGLLTGLVVLGGVGYGIFWFVKNRPDDVEKLLKQAGIVHDSTPTNSAPQAQIEDRVLKPIVLEPATSDCSDQLLPAHAAGMALNPRLIKSDSSVVLLGDLQMVIGREAGLDISLPQESSVSRRHAQIEHQNGETIVTDLGSTNGTFVNGKRIDSPTQLQPGDAVQFGGSEFRYEE